MKANNRQKIELIYPDGTKKDISYIQDKQNIKVVKLSELPKKGKEGILYFVY